MANIFLGDINHFATASLSGGSWESSAPLTELQNDDFARTARSTNALTTSTVILFDFGSSVTIDAAMFPGHNLSADAVVRWSFGTTSGASDVYSSGWVDAYTVPTIERDGAAMPIVLALGSSISARYGKLEIDDTSNVDGHVELSFGWCGEGFRPQYNAAYGLQDGAVTGSKVDRTYGGRLSARSGRIWRRVSFGLEVLSVAEAARIDALRRRAGISNPVCYIPSPDAEDSRQRFGLIGVVSELPPILYPSFRRRSVGFTVEEI